MMILLAYARGNVAFLTILIGEGPWDIVCREAWKLIPEGGARAYRILEGPNGRKVQRGCIMYNSLHVLSSFRNFFFCFGVIIIFVLYCSLVYIIEYYVNPNIQEK